MRTVRDVVASLGSKIPFDKAAGWDVCGLQLGDPAAQVNSIGVCHEVTDKVVARVIAQPVDLLVTYHPLLLRPTNRLTAGPGPIGRALRLLNAGVNLLVVHTAFDAAPGGTADTLASLLTLGYVEPFGMVDPDGRVKVVVFVPQAHVYRVADAMSAAGAGVVGNYRGCSFWAEGTGSFEAVEGASPVIGVVGSGESVTEARLEMVAPAERRGAVVAAMVAAHPYEEPSFDLYEAVSNGGFIGRVGELPGALPDDEFADFALRALGSPTGARFSGHGTTVSRVAVVPGSGGSFVAEAAATGADCLVTGDVGHHRVVEALDRGMAVVDVGHIAGERPGMATLVKWVTELEIDVVDLTDEDPTTWG